MIFLKALLFTIAIVGVNITVRSRKLSAVSDVPYTEYLYQKVHNKDPPSENDPARNDEHVRHRICEDVTRSGFFEWYAMEPVNLGEVYSVLTQPQYSDLFNQIYTPTQTSSVSYTNQYNLHKFEVKRATNDGPLYEIEEYAFICLLKLRFSDELVPFYVSKEYNVNVNPEGRRAAGRFLFGQKRFVIIAEESAEHHTHPNFKLELHYLQLREDHEPADSFERDPVCKLISKEPRENQHYRVCAIVLSSSHFGGRFKYPTRVNANAVIEDYVSFKTPEATLQSRSKQYQERLAVCPVRLVDSANQTRVYISRAYKSNEVFVYLRDPADGKLYLESLFVNVSIVVESE